MKRLKTKNQEIAAQSASRLDILRELDKRQALDDELKRERRQLENKLWAGLELIHWLENDGKKKWTVLQNFSFIYGTEVITCDVLLLTDKQIHCFDIDTRLRDQSSLALEKAQSSAPYIQEILRQAGCEATVEGYVLFLQEPLEWMTEHLSDTSHIITRNQLKDTVEDIIKRDNSCSSTLDSEAVFHLLEKEEFKFAYEPKPIDSTILEKVRPGICCSHCGSFTVEKDKGFVTCPCGMHESMEEAIVRTICEYGVMNQQVTYFDPMELFDFFNGDITYFQFMFYLNKHFAEVDLP